MTTSQGNGGTKQPFSIDDLVADLTPVNPVRIRDGIAMALALTLFISVAISFYLGIRSGLAAGNFETIFVARTFALLALGGVSAYAAMSLARPAVDTNLRKVETMASRTVLGISSVFPVLALIYFFADMPRSSVEAVAIFDPSIGRECLTYSGLSALAIGSAITVWLRRGAVVSPERAGWLTGLAAGGFGAAAYSLFCPMDSVVYIGTWFTMAVAMAAVAGRLAVPSLLRW
ncbi:NrsF family protein [Parasphingorhabdus sp. DH2-15]|uniref:NrsF family protein n=1 Tax=Parasphingorhabdus sp. DH2-15 TaxID=3444112 RepID=UPI003F685D40